MFAIYDKRNGTYIHQQGHRVPALFAKKSQAEARLKNLRNQVEFKECSADDVKVVPVRLVQDRTVKIEIGGDQLSRERVEKLIADINEQIGDHARLTVHTADEA